MNFLKFKPKKGEKYIIVENDKPVAVLISFEDYNQSQEEQKELPGIDEKKSGFQSFKEINEELERENDQKELKIEDLPF